MDDSPSTSSPLRTTGVARIWARELRLHQWIKNALIFLPPALGHVLFEPRILGNSLLAFIAFCLCASSVYLINDLFDLAADRVHPRKRWRPLAAGLIAPRTAIWAAGALLAAAACLALWVRPAFLFVLACYYAITWMYSLRLKRVTLLDVMVLASLYTLRLIAGSVATDVPASFWLLAFSLFIFLSLALIKRYAELVATSGDSGAGGYRPYGPDDMPLVLALGSASGYNAVVVIALYINSPESQAIYHHHQPLWLICPLMLFWISRAWMLTARGRMQDDPVVFAVRDPVSLVVVTMILAITLVAT